MSSWAIRAFVLVLTFLAAGCATKVKITADPKGNQQQVYQDGRSGLVSKKKHVVTVSPLQAVFKQDGRAKFVVALQNRSKKPFDVSTDNIMAEGKKYRTETVPDPSKPDAKTSSVERTVVSATIPLKIYTYEELDEEIDRKETQRKILAVLAGSLASVGSDSGYRQTTGSYTYESNRYGGPSGYGSYSETTYDYAAAAQSRRENEARTERLMGRIEEKAKIDKAEIQKTLLKRQTVMPGQWYGGTVVMDAPILSEPKSGIVIHISLGNDEHIFNFDYKKLGN